MLVLGTSGRKFESYLSDNANVTQLVEYLICNQAVVSSILIVSSLRALSSDG